MSYRPPVFTWTEELHFGPPSEPICVQTFVDDAQRSYSRGVSPRLESCSTDNDNGVGKNIAGWKEWQELPEDVSTSIKEDCNLDDLTSSLMGTFSSQKHMQLLQTAHAEAIRQCGVSLSQKKNKGKGSQGLGHDPDLEEFRRLIDNTPLKMWKLKPSARPYIRSGHVSDQNALDTLTFQGGDTPNDNSAYSPGALITITTYTRNTWYPFTFSRNSQYALLSNNTLADVWSCVPCALRGNGKFPREVMDVEESLDNCDQYMEPQGGRITGYNKGDTGVSEADPDEVVMVIEGVAYSNGRGSLDYADTLLLHLEKFKTTLARDQPPLPPGPYERVASQIPLTKGPMLDVVQLRSLTLRVNEPYWLLHHGSCEHWFVIDEIRLRSPRDPPTGYPIGLQLTPSVQHLCRICSKIPAALSVLNDFRLGESPSLVCQSCWEFVGGPPQPRESDDPSDAVVVVPIAFGT